MASRTVKAGAESRAEPRAATRAVSMLISRCLGSCRCTVGFGLCGLHRLAPVVDEAQGAAAWKAEMAEPALVEAGTRADTRVRRRWAEDLVAAVLDGQPGDEFRLGERGLVLVGGVT